MSSGENYLHNIQQFFIIQLCFWHFEFHYIAGEAYALIHCSAPPHVEAQDMEAGICHTTISRSNPKYRAQEGVPHHCCTKLLPIVRT
jgi:hypothetical protein